MKKKPDLYQTGGGGHGFDPGRHGLFKDKFELKFKHSGKFSQPSGAEEIYKGFFR